MRKDFQASAFHAKKSESVAKAEARVEVGESCESTLPVFFK